MPLLHPTTGFHEKHSAIVAEPSRLCSFSGETPLPLSAYSLVLLLGLVLYPHQQINIVQ